MKFNKFLLAALIASLTGQVTLASTSKFDDDDIYYNPSKSKKEAKVSSAQTVKSDKRGTIVTGKDGNEYIVTNEGMAYPVQAVNYAGSDAYVVNSGSTRDVDEYNRRSSSSTASGSSTATSAVREDFANTRQIERYYNPDIVVSTGDDDFIDMYYTQTQPQEVNIYVNTTPSWNSFYGPTYSAWNYWNSWDSWNWYTSAFYYPSLSWSWGWSYNPWWGPSYYNPWFTPSWSWSWGGWYPGWGPAWNPGPRPNPGPSHTPSGSFRPHRPSAGNFAGNTRPGGYRGDGINQRPGNNNGNGNHRPGNQGFGVNNGGMRPSSPSLNQGSQGGYRGQIGGNRPSSGSSVATSPSYNNSGNNGGYRQNGTRPNASTVIGNSSSSGRGSGSYSTGGRRGGSTAPSSSASSSSSSRRNSSSSSSSYNSGSRSSSSSMGSSRSSGGRSSSGGGRSGGGHSSGGGRR